MSTFQWGAVFVIAITCMVNADAALKKADPAIYRPLVFALFVAFAMVTLFLLDHLIDARILLLTPKATP